MKRLIRIMYILLVSGLMFAMSGCKTKENVTQNIKETTHAASSKIKEDVSHDESLECDSSAEHSHLTQENDSLVEKFRERIIEDSSGRILFKNSEYIKERYQGRNTANAKKEGSSYHASTGQALKRSQEEVDSSKTATHSNTVKTEKPTCRWLWFLGLLTILFIAGAIISKVTR